MNIDRDTYEAWLLDRLEGRLSADQDGALAAFLAANPDLPIDLGELPSIKAGDASFGDLSGLKRTYPPQGLPDASRIADFLIARNEGDLSVEQVKALERFLFEHPEHERTARLVAATRVPAAPVPLLTKAKLEKHFPPVGMPDRDRITDFLIAAGEGDLGKVQRTALSGLVASDAVLQREEALVKAARISQEAVVFPEKASLKRTGGRVVPLWSFGSPLVRYAAAASVALLLGLAWWTLGTGSLNKQEEAHLPQRSAKPGGSVVPITPVQRDDQAADPSRTSSPDTEQPSEQPQERSAPKQHSRPQSITPEPMEPTLAQHPAPKPAVLNHAEVPVVPVAQDAPEQLAAVAPAASQPTGVPSRTVGELLAAGVRDRVLDQPTNEARSLDGADALALADKGLKGITGGSGAVQVQRSAKRDRFKIRLGEGLAFSGSIGR
ncbi:MAG: hypothetical protein IPP26_05565 [Flavobacteriales bacterium]|nr:hypothetical protein [Flavobacteriales bacterium]